LVDSQASATFGPIYVSAARRREESRRGSGVNPSVETKRISTLAVQ
jgi:hypothetical protein